MPEPASYEKLERRIEGLQRELRRTSCFEAINRVLLGISETVCRASVLDKLFASIRSVLSSVIGTRNFSIALYDADQDSLSFPYCVDTLDPDYGSALPGQSSTETLTGEVVGIGRPFFASRDEILRPGWSVFIPGIRQLFMSGYTADVIARHGVLEEGLQFMEKPFSARDLTRRIRQVLEGVQVPVTQSADITQPRK